MNIWRQFNLANQSFLSDWRILYWRMLLYLHALGNKKENLTEFNLADFHNSPNHQNKFYTKFLSYTVHMHRQVVKLKMLLQFFSSPTKKSKNNKIEKWALIAIHKKL